MWTQRNSTQLIYLFGALLMSATAADARVVAALARPDAPSHPPRAAKVSKVLTVSKKDHDATLHMAKGGHLAVRLEGNPGTGYSWTLENPDPKRFQPHGKPVHEAAPKQMPGATETTVFYYKALQEGSSTLKFVLKRPFEKDAEPAERFTFTVEVSAK